MKYKPFPLSDLKKLHLVDPGAFLHSFRQTWVFLIVVICTLMTASNAVAQSWTSQTITSTTLNEVYFVNATTGYVVGENGSAYKTINGGTNWTVLTITSTTLNAVHFVDANTGWVVGNQGTIYKTTNGGTTWTDQSISSLSIPFTDVHFVNATTGWAVGNAGVISYTTDGSTWTRYSAFPDPEPTLENLTSVHFVNATTGWAVGGHSGVVIKYTGSAWSTQTLGTSASLNAVHFVDANTGWVVGKELAMYKGFIGSTTNGGMTWTPQINGLFWGVNSVHFVDASTGWAVGDYGTILHTTNGGTNWAAQTSGVAFDINSVHFVDASNGWAVGDNGTILKFQLASAPAAPTNLVATPCGSQVEISFTAGANGGSPITNYEYSLDGMSWTAFSPTVTASPVTISALTSGTYNISLRAVNSVGTGVSSNTVTATIDTNAAITVTYTGTTLATTTNKSANITLSATVTLPVGSNASQQAQLRFIDRGTGQDLSGWLSLTGTSNTGTVSHTAALTLGTYEIFRKYNIGIELGGAGCYTRNSPADNVTVTVAEPSCGCY